MKIILSILALLTAQSAVAQPKNSNFRLDWGIASTARQDEIFSPFVQRGQSPVSVSLAWQRARRSNFQHLELGLTSLAASHSATYDFQNLPDLDTSKTFPHGFTLLDFQFRLGKIFQQKNLRWHAGLTAAANLDAFDFQYGRTSSFGYFIDFSLGLRVGAAHEFLKKHRLGASLDVPLVAWVARSPYLVNDDEFIENTASHRSLRTLSAFVADGSLRSFGSFQNLKLEVFYRFQAAWRWGFVLRHGFGLLHFSEPLPVRVLENRISMGVEFQI